MLLPYTKTEVIDNSAYQSSLVIDTGINIATIIKADTGPMDRVSLQNTEDLIAYFCTGTKLTAKLDQTIQCIGALLATSPVDVIRVGKAYIKVGRTEKGNLVYTDSEYKVIDKLTRLKFTSKVEDPDILCIRVGKTIYYVTSDMSKKPTVLPGYSLRLIEGPVTLDNLLRGLSDAVIAWGISQDGVHYVITEQNEVACEEGELDTLALETTYVSTDKKLVPIINSKVPVDGYITIDGIAFYFIGDGTSYSADNVEKLSKEGQVILIKNSLNNISTDRFLAKVASAAFVRNLSTNIQADVKYDFSHVIEYSQGENDSYGYTNTYDFTLDISDNKIFSYDEHESMESGYFTIDNFPDGHGGYTKRRFAWNMPDTTFIKEGEESIPTYSITTSEDDFVQILQEFELLYGTNFDTLIDVWDDLALDTPSLYFNNSTISIATFDEYCELEEVEDDGFYKTYIWVPEVKDNELSVYVDGVVYYIGENPAELYEDVINTVRLGDSPMTVSEFTEKLINELEADLVMARVNMNTVLISNKVEAISKSNIQVGRALIMQGDNLRESGDKFAIVAKFPSTKKLFSYSYVKDTTIEDYDVLKLTYTYNQISGTMTFSFNDDAVDGYGNALYYDKYNDGQYENVMVKIVEINEDAETPQNTTPITVDSWGNEVLMGEPQIGNYQTAMLRFNDYEDKQYRLIWDSGYSNPQFAKTMFTVAVEKNAQAIPSYPVTYRKGNEEDVLNYYVAIGVDSPRMYHIIPAHKSIYNGSYLTTCPGSLCYIVARVNSYKNITPEFQPLFGSVRGTVSAPNLVWNINKATQQKFADSNINCIVNNINGVYINFNMTGQKKLTYLSEEQNMYISDVIAGVCDQYNPTLIAEQNNADLWDNVETTLTSMINQRVVAGKNPTIYKFRVRCRSVMEANPDFVESRLLKYYVDVQYIPSISYVNCYVNVVRLNSF